MNSFTSNQYEIIERLINSLDVLIERLEDGVIPNKYEKERALLDLSEYTELIDKCAEGGLIPFKRVVAHGASEFISELTKEEVVGLRTRLTVLYRLARERIIEVNDSQIESEDGKLLIQKGYCEEIEIDDSHYFILSEKALRLLTDRNMMSELKESSPEALIPACIISDSKTWTYLYIKRLILIHKYFVLNGEPMPYMVFSLQDSSPDMLFGCEISNNADICYVFAGIFDDRASEQIKILIEIARCGLIDRLVVCVEEKKDEERLIKNGISPETVSQIQVCIV